MNYWRNIFLQKITKEGTASSQEILFLVITLLSSNSYCAVPKKYPYRSQGRFFVLHPLLPLNSSLDPYFASNIFAFLDPPPPRKFSDLPKCGYGFFLL